MIEKIALKVEAQVTTGGKLPGQTFRVNAIDGQPADLYWRSRIADGAVIVVPDEFATAADPVESAAPSLKGAPKAANKQKD